VNALVGFALTSGVFAMIYKLMPRVTVRWHDVWLGSVVTALLFTVGQFLIGLYIGKSAVASGFGAAGSLIIIFVWVYYSAQIFLMGAEFTWIYAETFGSRRSLPITPNPGPGAEIFDATGGVEPQLPASRQEAPSPLPSEPAADTPSLAGVGVAIAAVVTIRYLLPKLLRGGRGRK
jgi:membrane protein